MNGNQFSGNFPRSWFRVTYSSQLRDVGTHPPAHPMDVWVTANYTPPEDRTSEMIEVLAESERLIDELL